MSRPPRSAGGESWKRSAFRAGDTAGNTKKRSTEKVSASRSRDSLFFMIIAPDSEPGDQQLRIASPLAPFPRSGTQGLTRCSRLRLQRGEAKGPRILEDHRISIT